ncbi:MAG: hypothetical protein HY040_00850 [Planctomycetes bacterium]|nr:hypothetical protein [Planctomycetota bacterium]
MARKKKQLKLPLDPVPDLLLWWKQTGVTGMVIGGVAVALLGRPRTTKDVDAVALVEEADWGRFLEVGATYTFQPRFPDTLEFARKNRVLLLLHEKTGVQIDISLGNLPYEKAAIAQSRNTKVGKLTIPLPRPEDLIVLKSVAHRIIDMTDIVGLLDAQPNVDKAYIRRWLDYFAAELEFPEIYTDVDALLTRTSKSPRKQNPKKS